MDCLHPNNAGGAKHIRAMIVSDDVSDDNADDGTKCDEDCVELWEGDW
jgi:hypothetical protein